LPQSSLGASAARRTPGIVLTGQLTNVLYATQYTYDVEVVTAKSYKHAAVALTVPESDCRIERTINTTAHKPWRSSFTVAFESMQEANHGVEVAVYTPPSKKGSHLLLGKEYAVTFAQGQVPQPQSSTPACPDSQSFVGS